MTEFAKSPLAAFRVLQEPGAYASTAIVRMETDGVDMDTSTEMVLWCIHQKVFEAFCVHTLHDTNSINGNF